MPDRALTWGYRRYPEHVLAVWGARLIKPNDLLHDRQDLVGDDPREKHELVAWLNGSTRGQGALRKALDHLATLFLADIDEEFVVYEDELGKIVGNTQASHGYVYVAGWLHAHVPDPG